MADRPRTLAFCTTYVGLDTPAKGRWDTRYRRWVEAMRLNGLAFDQLLLIDDGSPEPPDWPDCCLAGGDVATVPDAPLLLYHFDQRLGRPSVSDFPGWVRSYFFAAEFAVSRGFDKVVHLESDAFLIGRSIVSWANAFSSGWNALWCSRYSRPETGIQLMAGSGLTAWRNFARQPVEALTGAVVEDVLPFTGIERRFTGDRYTEYLDHIPRDAEWCMQAECPAGHDPSTFYWWLPAQIVAPSAGLPDRRPDHRKPLDETISAVSSGTGSPEAKPADSLHNRSLTPASPDAMPVHDLPFERLLDLSEFATGDSPHRFDLFAGGLSMPEATVRVLGADGALRDGELQYRSALPPVSLYSLPGHIIGGGGAARGHGAGRSVFWREDCTPNYFRDAFTQTQSADADPVLLPPHPLAGSLGNPAAEMVDFDHPIAIVAHRNAIYGHALLEMLPKAWLIGQLARMGRPLHVALDADAPAWLVGLIGVFVPPERIVRYDALRQVLRAPAVVVPSMMQLDYYLHPAFNLLVEDMLDRVLGFGPRPAPVRRLFLSRGGLGELSMLGNGEAFERRLAAAGFEILRPETMPFDEQLRAYAGARVIVSEYGSASHNALFAPRGGTHVVINRINGLQERIAALRGQALGFVEPEGGWIKRVNADRSTWRRAAVDPEAVLRLIETMERPRTPAGQPAPIRVARETMTVEGYVNGLDDGAEKPVLAPMTEVALPAFICHEPVDPATAPFARLFQPNAPRSYTAQPMLCARLSGASLLGDSGLVLWRGSIPSDTADRADWARAAGIELAVSPNGRPAPVAFDKRSHPGQAVYQAFTGRWLDDASFLVECLPRLVAYLRLTGPGTVGTAILPASPPGSIQQRALDLLGVPGVETIGPDRVVTGSAVWLPSGIDPWQPTPLVVEAARALADRVPPAQVPTPRRLYLRAPRDARPPLRGFEALVPVLAKHGFESVTLAEHDLDTRIRLMRGAEIVITEAAGGSAHVMFCRPGAQVLELFNPVFVQPATYTIAALAGVGFGFLVGRHVSDPNFEEPGLASAYTVSPERLDAALGSLPRAQVAASAPPQAAPAPAPVAAPVTATPASSEQARPSMIPRPFFAAPALPEQERAAATVAVVARTGVSLDGHGVVRPAAAGDTVLTGDVIATLAPAGIDPLLGALPRLIAARLLREKNPEARIVLPLSGPVRRIAELLAIIDGSVVLSPDAAVTADRLWTVDGLDLSPDTMPPDVFRRAGAALRDAVPTTDAESMGLIPSRILICAAQPDAMLENALSAHGFVAVAWSGLSIDEQVRVMRTAQLVVLEPGHAACVVLARPGTRVLEAGHPTARGLAAICGLDYGCIGDAGALDAAVEALVG